jgi:hypothetical protein
MYVMDFNVHPKRLRDPSANLPSTKHEYDRGYQMNTVASTVVAGKLFKQDVTSMLPYAVSHRTAELRGCKGFMIDEERIVGMKVRRHTYCTWCS